MTLPRILAIMGSGETAPTMIKLHRELLARLGSGPQVAALLDTPFGFQTNADDIVAKTREYFEQSVGHTLEVASFRSAAASDPLDYERMLVCLRRAHYVFAGPGSPSYALRQWVDSLIPKVLIEKLQAGGSGGCVTFASAAAVTLGRLAVPVYEIYKVGEDPHWLEGLDLMAELGLNVAVIPHYDNAEGGTHDTRFCYLGEPRLAQLEAELDDDTFVLGVDEHTALVLDLDSGTAEVTGRSTATVRKQGRSTVLPVGTVVTIADLRTMASAPADGGAAPSVSGVRTGAGASEPDDAPGGSTEVPRVATSPLLESVARLEAAFDQAVDARDAPAAVRAVLELDDEMVAWSRDTLQSDEGDRARAALRGMIVRLGELAVAGVRNPSEVVGPFVDTILDARAQARDQQRWSDADRLRDHLVALGVEVADTPEGTSWRLLD